MSSDVRSGPPLRVVNGDGDGRLFDALYAEAVLAASGGCTEKEVLEFVRTLNGTFDEPWPAEQLEEIAAEAFARHASRPQARSGSGSAVVVPLSTVKPERVTWLWPGRLPRGKVVVIDGDPGLGKSTAALDLAARLSTGRPMPDGAAGALGSVVVISLEDGLADTIVPRLNAAGADLERVRSIHAIRTEEGERLPELPADTAELEHVVRLTRAVLVIVDPLAAVLGGEVNSYRDQDVRRALAPLAGMADRTGATVLVVRHLTKGSGGSNALYRGAGSIGIIGAARAGFLVAKDPDDPSRRVFAQTKSNLGPEAPTLGYRLVEARGGVAAVEWLGQVAHDARSVLAAAAEESAPEDGRSASDEAAAVLRELLAEGPLPAKEVQRQVRDAGVSERALRRAKERLGVRAAREGFGPGARYVWSLPEACVRACSPYHQKRTSMEDRHSMEDFGHLQDAREGSGPMLGRSPDVHDHEGPGLPCWRVSKFEAAGIRVWLTPAGKVASDPPPAELIDRHPGLYRLMLDEAPALRGELRRRAEQGDPAGAAQEDER